MKSDVPGFPAPCIRDGSSDKRRPFLVALRALTAASAQGARMSHLATGTFTVNLQPMPFEGTDPRSKLMRMSIDKEITGDLVATTKGQMLSAATDTEGSAGYVAIERVTGTLDGRKGSLVLQHNAVMNRGVPSLSIAVVPDSGTGELAGLTGSFEIVIENGRHTYRFTYQLSPPSGD